MKENELMQKLHEAVDLLQKAKDTGLDAEVKITLEDGEEQIRLDVRESASGPDYYLTGYYTPEGGRR